MLYVFSDIHIGDERINNNLELLFKTINGLDRKGTIILNGDCFDFIRCKDMNSLHYKFIELVNQFFNVIYIIGNHDYNAREKLKNVNFLMANEFVVKNSGKKIKILHGHQADFFARRWPIISKIVININSFIYKITKIDIERKIKKINFFRKLFSNHQENKLIKKYINDFDCVISGHTHHLVYSVYPEFTSDGSCYINNIKKSFVYINSGDWIDHCGYIIINNGEFSLVRL